MKKFLTLLPLLCGFTFGTAHAATRNSLLESDTMVWAGLDYSLTRMIGPVAFQDADAIFPGMLNSWNDLFLKERLRFVSEATGKRLLLDTDGVRKVNAGANASQIITSPGLTDSADQSHITPDMIASKVRSYDLQNKSGLGVVFIVDRLVKLDKKASAAIYVVAFDVATREVLSSQREVQPAGGFGFRNFWFRPVKTSERALKKLR